MSDIDQNDSIEEDLTVYSTDESDQLQPEDTLEQEDVDDVLDRGYSPGETERGTDAFGTTAYAESQAETIAPPIHPAAPDPATVVMLPSAWMARTRLLRVSAT